MSFNATPARRLGVLDWDPSDPILGLSDGVYDLVFLPLVLGGIGWLAYGWATKK